MRIEEETYDSHGSQKNQRTSDFQENQWQNEDIWLLLKNQMLLCRHQGWDEAACDAHRFAAFEQQSKGDTQIIAFLDEAERGLNYVGSPTYMRLFRQSELSHRAKVQLVLKHLGGGLDEHGMLQLEGPLTFDPQLEPHSRFYEYFAECVKHAYPGGLVIADNPHVSKIELKMVHQLRHYIDRQNLLFIRCTFDGETDYDKLLSFAKMSNQKLRYGGSSRFHNRVSSDTDMRKDAKKGKRLSPQTNDKITTQNGLSEFILNVETGCFVSQWNQLELTSGGRLFDGQREITKQLLTEAVISDPSYYELSGEAGKEIADTESFNYDRGFLDWLPWRRNHQRFDMKPGGQEKMDSDLRKQAKKCWRFPKRYVERYRSQWAVRKDEKWD